MVLVDLLGTRVCEEQRVALDLIPAGINIDTQHITCCVSSGLQRVDSGTCMTARTALIPKHNFCALCRACIPTPKPKRTGSRCAGPSPLELLSCLSRSVDGASWVALQVLEGAGHGAVGCGV